jgi:acetyltransferase-like isoleucine patch superfamily enzyme
VRNSRIGAYTYLTREVRVENAAIDSYCSIGPEAIIGGLGRHPTDHFSTSPVTYSPQHPITRILGRNGFDLGFQELARVDIGPDVWIGARAVIADGVRIGAGAVIGANTFIAKDVPPYAIVYGSPPRIHRFRFPPEVVTRLLASEWWLRAPDRIDVHELLGICSLKPGSDSAAANAVK